MRILSRRIYFLRYEGAGGRGPSNKWYIIILRLFVKSNVLCKYNDNKLVSRPQGRKLSKPFCSRPKCVLK